MTLARRIATRVVLCAALSAFAVALTMVIPRPALAQGSRRLAPIGGRTTLMGGAGLVYGSDSSAAFLNPATVVRIDSGRLAFAVNFYRLTVVNAPRWYQPGEVDQGHFGDVQRSGSSATNVDIDALPGSLCLFLPVADIKAFARKASEELRARRARLGLCLANVEKSTYTFNDESYSQTGAFGVSRQASSVRQTFSRFSIGPTYSMYIDNALAVGASLHFNRSSLRSSISNTSTLYGGATPISSIVFDTARGDSNAFSFMMGATYRIGKHQTLAAVVELPSLYVFGSGGMSNFSHSDAADVSTTSSVVASGSFKTQTPWRLAIGTGMEEPWGSAELNVTYTTVVPEAFRAELDGRSYDTGGSHPGDRVVSDVLTARARGVINIAVGAEYFFSPGLSILFGAGTDLSAVPRGTLGNDPFHFFPSETNRVLGSVGVGSHGDSGDLLLGTELSYGWGDLLATNPYVLPPRVETTQQTQYAVIILLAGSTSLRNITRAVQEVGHALDPTGTKKPPPPTR